jgi:FtsH-binding integral membrane protein
MGSAGGARLPAVMANSKEDLVSQAQELSYLGDFPIAAEASVAARAVFIRKTYLHLIGAILTFIGIEWFLLTLPGIDGLLQPVIGSKGGMLLALGGFLVVNWLAERWARSTTSVATQYLGLSVYVLAEAAIFLPLLYIAMRFGGPDVIPTAGLVTLLTFAGLTAYVFLTKQDLSFLGGILSIAGLAALGLIVCSIFFGFTLGTVFTVAMIVLAAGYILYDTSNVLHRYHTNQHVAASLALFASVALLFWYVLRFFLDRR